MAEASRGHVALSRGQGAELYWRRNPRALTSLEVLGIFREKTAPAFEVALRLGALFAGADDNVHSVLGPYSEALGIAYQIRDDLEDFLRTNCLDQFNNTAGGWFYGKHILYVHTVILFLGESCLDVFFL